MHRPCEQGANASHGANGWLTGKAPKKRAHKCKPVKAPEPVDDMKQAAEYISDFIINKYKLPTPTNRIRTLLYIGGAYNATTKCRGYSYILADDQGDIFGANSCNQHGKVRANAGNSYFVALQAIKQGLQVAYDKGYKVVDIPFQPKAMPMLVNQYKQDAFISSSYYAKCINEYRSKGMLINFIPYGKARGYYSVRYRNMCELWAQYGCGLWEGKHMSNSKTSYMKKLSRLRKRFRKENIKSKNK